MLQTSRRKIGQCLLTLIRIQPGQSRELSLTSRILFCKTQPLKAESEFNANDEQSVESGDNETHSANLEMENSIRISDFYKQFDPQIQRKEPASDQDFEGIYKLRSRGENLRNKYGDTRNKKFQAIDKFPRRSAFSFNPWPEQLDQEDNGYRKLTYSKKRFKYQNEDSDSFSGSSEEERPKLVKKNFYSEHSDVTNRPQNEVDEFLQKHEVTLTGRDIPRPIFTLEEAGFPDRIQEVFKRRNFTSPTHIQSVTWPIVSSGRDCIGIAQTGSGKTLAFALPAIIHVKSQRPRQHRDGPIALIMVPTRELVQQVVGVLRMFTDKLGLSVAAAYGGAMRSSQIRELYKGHICVATPGRLNDFLQSGETSMNRCTFLVLDEADRMLEMGFEDQINMIIRDITPERQTVMWSATWPEEVQELAGKYLVDPIQVNVGSSELTVNKDITHSIQIVQNRDKFQSLENILVDLDPSCKVLMFTDTKASADRLCHKLSVGMGGCIESLHGDKSQSQRDRIMRDFKYGRKPLLVATDVASRGLDVNDVTHIINYNFPREIESYVHRVGRTGRAGKRGTAISFFNEEDSFAKNPKNVRKLVKLLQDADQEINPDLFHMCSPQRRYDNRREKSRYRTQHSGNNWENFKPRSFSYKKNGNNFDDYKRQSFGSRKYDSSYRYDDEDFS